MDHFDEPIRKVYLHGRQHGLRWARYQAGDIALILMDGEEVYAKATVSVISVYGSMLLPDQGVIKNWSENLGMLEALEDAHVCARTGQTVRTGHVEAPIVNWLPLPDGRMPWQVVS